MGVVLEVGACPHAVRWPGHTRRIRHLIPRKWSGKASPRCAAGPMRQVQARWPSGLARRSDRRRDGVHAGSIRRVPRVDMHDSGVRQFEGVNTGGQVIGGDEVVGV